MSDTAESEQEVARVFPTPGPALYTPDPAADTPDARAARRVLALGVPDLPRRQRLGRGLDPAARVGRLFYLHRLGLEAELAGQAGRADFYWDEVIAELARMPVGHAGWKAVAERLAADQPGTRLADPDELRRRVAREVFLDTHRAFAAGAELDNRAGDHVGRAVALLEPAGLTPATGRSLVAPAFEAFVDAARVGKNWSRAAALTNRLRRWFPQSPEYANQYAEFLTLEALEACPRTASDAESRAQASRLEAAAHRLERYCEEVPFAPAAFDGIGHLHQLRAVKLANGDRPSQALVAVEQALTYKPDWDDALEARRQIEELLRNLQQKMRDVASRLGTFYAGYNTTRTVTLTAEGEAMRAEANAGTGPRDRYRNSGHRQQVAERFARAKGRSLWLRIGLPVPETEWDAQARDLDVGTDVLMARKPENGADLFLKWLQVVDDRPELRLARFDPLAVCTFFLRGAPTATDPVPSLKPAPSAGGPSPPLDFWFLTARDAWSKAALAAGVVALAAAGLLAGHQALQAAARDAAYGDLRVAAELRAGTAVVSACDRFDAAASRSLAQDPRGEQVEQARRSADEWDRARRRDEAFADLEAAARKDDDQAMLMAAERFDAVTPRGTDPRGERVLELRRAAIDAPGRRRRDEAFARMTAAGPGHDAEVVAAGEDFFRAPGAAADPRAARVRSDYEAAFVRWCGTLPGDPDAAALARIDAFRKLNLTGR